jgi:hypothetical protein
LRHFIEGKIEGRTEMIGRWVRRHKKLPDDLQKKRGYWKLKDETADCTLWRTHSGRGYGQKSKWMNIDHLSVECKIHLFFTPYMKKMNGN